VPDDWAYEQARKLFKQPEIVSAEEVETSLKWTEPDEEGLVSYMVKEKGFS